MLSHCSQGKENSRPNMVRSLSVLPAPQQHDTPHLLLSAPAIPDGQTPLSSLSSPSSLSHQAFALSLPQNILSSLFGSQLSHHLLKEALPTSQTRPDPPLLYASIGLCTSPVLPLQFHEFYVL